MSTNENLIISHLDVFYKDRDKSIWQKDHRRQVLFDVSAVMEKGEILAVAGESGCGKSTLARTIVGINRDYTGSIVNGIGHPQMVFQDPYGSLNPSKKIGWLMEEPLRVDRSRTYTPEERRGRVREILQEVELTEDLLDRYPNQLSGGQRQRACIGIALMQNPSLLIADEPVSALDVTIQAQILDLLRRLHEERGLSILFISHDLRVIWQIADHVLIMRAGRVVEYGETRELYNHPKEEYTRKLLKAANLTE